MIKGAGRGIVGNVNVGPAVVVEIGCDDTQSVRAVRGENSGGFGNIGEGAVTIVVKKDIFATDEPWGAAGDHYTFVETWTGFGNWRSRQIHIDVVGDE